MPILSQIAAYLSTMLKQSLPDFCEIETSHDGALVTKQGDYLSMVRIDGSRRMMTRKDVEAMAESQRLEISGALENKGHALAGWYISDPALAEVEIERLSLKGCRQIAELLRLDLSDILNERAARWPQLMRWEAAYYVLWTRGSVLTKEERKQAKDERNELAKQFHRVGNSQRFYMRSETMAARHAGFVQRVLSSLQAVDVACEELDPHDALKVTREAIYRESVGSAWRPILLGDRFMPRMPDTPDDVEPHPGVLLWPAVREQLFTADAETHGGQRVTIGDYEFAPVDMALGPDDPRPFIELAAKLGRGRGDRRIPWRASFLIEGGGKTAMSLKEAGAGFLTMFPGNRDIRRAFDGLKQIRERNHISVRLRASFATWAPVGETRTLRRQVANLTQSVEAWGNCRATQISGDPLEATLSSVPGLALGSTANASLAALGDALAMMPTNRTAAPWQEGAVLFRRPDGSMVPYDPVGGNVRPLVCDLLVAPPGGGKSVMGNTINLGLCLSTAAMGNRGAKLPLVGRIDIGRSAEGFVEVLRNALGTHREHEAIFVSMQFLPGYEVNVFDLQLGCEYPLKLERAFLENFLALATLPMDGQPFEGMNQLIGRVIDEAYRSCTEVPGGSPKLYRPGVETEVDAALRRFPGALRQQQGAEHVVWWRDVVNALISHGEHRLAAIAQRHAVPVMNDLIRAVQGEVVVDSTKDMRLQQTNETLNEIFERYIYDFMRTYETLACPTRLDFGSARVIVMDLAAVAPSGGSSASKRTTEIMYMVARQILARNFFLHPDYADEAPPAIRDYLRAKFQENVETVKRLDYDEWHRTNGSPQVQKQAELDVREGRKHNTQIGFASQHMSDFSDQLIADSTARFVLKVGDEKEAEEIIHRFRLSDASAEVVRKHLPGPGPSGAPFLLIVQSGGKKYEQLLVNSLGPIELWAFSTTPGDTALRGRVYARLGSSEALRRLATVFPDGSAGREIEDRKKGRLRLGGSEVEAEASVVDELAAEILNGEGVAMILRDQARLAKVPDLQAAE